MASLRLPPFAARHAASARAGFAPRNFICVLCGWPPKRGIPAIWKHAAWKASVPDDLDPGTLDWTWVAGFDVFVVDTRNGGGKRANRVLQAVSTAGGHGIGLTPADDPKAILAP